MDIQRKKKATPPQVPQTPAPESVSVSYDTTSEVETDETTETLRDVLGEHEFPHTFKQRVRIMDMVRRVPVGGWSIILILISIVGFAALNNPVEEKTSGDSMDDVLGLRVEDAIPVEGAESGAFDSTKFYGLQTPEELYFGRVTQVDEQFYWLEDIFYEREATLDVDSSEFDPLETSRNITLVKFGTEDYRPEDRLLLPKDRVRQIFELSENSPILSAIEGYFE